MSLAAFIPVHNFQTLLNNESRSPVLPPVVEPVELLGEPDLGLNV